MFFSKFGAMKTQKDAHLIFSISGQYPGLFGMFGVWVMVFENRLGKTVWLMKPKHHVPSLPECGMGGMGFYGPL